MALICILYLFPNERPQFSIRKLTKLAALGQRTLFNTMQKEKTKQGGNL